METFADKLRAFGLALTVHVLCILAMLIGMWWTIVSRPVSMPGPIIQVDLVGPTAAPKAKARSVAVSRPAPPKPAPPKPPPVKPDIAKPEPPKVAKEPDAPPPTEVERQNPIDQERIAALAAEKAEKEKREQEEKRHQEQVLLEEKQRKLEEERKKQLADIRRQREAAEKALKLEKQKLAQLEDVRRRDQQKAEQDQAVADHEADRAQTGAGGRDDDLAARYAAAIQSAVTNNWNRPDSASAGLRCSVDIVQIPGGDVIRATVVSPCNADPVTRNSIEQAVMKASPLPYQGYEKVFQRSVRFNFKYDG